MLKIAAAEQRHVWEIDIVGAYLNADMDADTFMMINKQVVDLLKFFDPSCIPFIRPDGTLMVNLLQAL